MASCPHMGGFQLWFMVDMMVLIAPVGLPKLSSARIQASAKQVVFTKFPFTQATEKIKGRFPALVRLFISELLKLVVPQLVVLPCPQ